MNLEQLEAKARAKNQKNQPKQEATTRTPVNIIVQQAINETIGVKNIQQESAGSHVQGLLEKINKYEAEIEVLKLMNTKGVGPTKNQEKILVAIRNEILNQNKNQPVITRSMFIKTYRVSSRLFDGSLKDLLAKEVISRKQVVYAGALATFAYEFVTLKTT